uniref:Fucosyltransferase n=1 Tax=Parastrongyloides trichosuri TaxID=131310 RepID=A0A0N4ZE02_PARTI
MMNSLLIQFILLLSIFIYIISSEFPILVWYQRKWHKEESCQYLQCYTTFDRKKLINSSAVIINEYHVKSDGDKISFQFPDKTINPKALYIYSLFESSVRSFKRKEYNKVKLPRNYFNAIYSYINTSDIVHRFSGPWIFIPSIKQEITSEIKSRIKNSVLKDKKHSITWIVSHCRTVSGREKSIKQLERYIDIKQYGKCSDNKIRKDEKIIKKLFQKSYFFIASENTDCYGYITEKYWDRYYYNSIPIVNIRSIYQNTLPPHSFIAMDDFKNSKDMVKFLKYLIKNKDKYIEYFYYKYQGWYNTRHNEFCSLCHELILFKKNNISRTYEDTREWIRRNDKCYTNDYVYKLWNHLL